MKKTISIHLMGIHLLVEEDAYELVKNYLDRLNNSLNNSTDQKEICEDVEFRIAELAEKYLSEKKKVVTFEEMKAIIDVLGQPEEFVDDIQHENKKNENSSIPIERHLFRDTEAGVIGGVCAGFSAYFNFDLAIIRLIFVIVGLFGGFAIPLYIILWIVVPKAKTNIQRLQMQGKPINIETLKEELNDATQRFKKSTSRFQNEMKDVNSPVRSRMSSIGRIVGKIVGIVLIVLGCFWMLSLLFISMTGYSSMSIGENFNTLSFHELNESIAVSKKSAFYFCTGLYSFLFSLIMIVILLGLLLFFSLKSKWIKRSFTSLSVISFLGFLVMLFHVLLTANDFRVSSKMEYEIGTVKDSVLYVQLSKPITKMENQNFNFKITNDSIFMKGIDVRFVKTKDSLFNITQSFSARGKDFKSVDKRLSSISHHYVLENNRLMIDNHYAFKMDSKFRNQSVTYVIEVPENGKIMIQDRIISSDNFSKYGYFSSEGRFYLSKYYDED
jgi:phage shock protein PspC (stress-responsive transcriptional regulator)